MLADVLSNELMKAQRNRETLSVEKLWKKGEEIEIPIPNLSSKEVIQALLQVFSRSGYPKEIQSDLGSSFTSELTSEFFNKFGIKVIHSSACHPQSNSVERVHSTWKQVLKALCLECGKG